MKDTRLEINEFRRRTVAEMTGDPLAPAQVGVEIKKRS